MTSLELAAWVQTFGVIVAIVAGFWYAGEKTKAEHKRLRYASALQRRERLKAASQLVTAVKRIATRTRALGQVVPDPTDADAMVELFVVELQVVGESIRKFDLSLFTSHVPIEAMLVSGSLARLLARRLEESLPLGGGASVRRHTSMLDVAIGELDERSARIARLLARPREI